MPCHVCKERGYHECHNLVQFTFDKCGHTCNVLCYLATSGKAKCTHTCDAPLPCGHKCGLTCGHADNHQCKNKNYIKCRLK